MAGVHVGPVDHIHSPLPSFGLLLTLAYQHLYVSTNRHILASLPLHYNQSKTPLFTLTLPAVVSCTSTSTNYIYQSFLRRSAFVLLRHVRLQPSLDSIFLMLLAYMSTKYTMGPASATTIQAHCLTSATIDKKQERVSQGEETCR